MTDELRWQLTVTVLIALLAAAVVCSWEAGRKANLPRPVVAGLVAAAVAGGWFVDPEQIREVLR